MIAVVKGLPRLLARFQKMGRESNKRVARATNRAAFAIQGEARRLVLTPPKTGKRRGNHTASAPGESPASDTGNLARNIIVVAAKPAPVTTAEVRARTKYAKALEFGTRKAGRSRNVIIEPRPFFAPAVKNMKKKVNSIFKEEMKGLGGES
jgi:HK97 gp10 family phage protein